MTNNTVPNGQVYAWLNEFCRRYFQLRDPEGTLELLSPGFLSVGTGEGEVAVGKEQFRRLLLEELQVLPWPMSYQIEDYAQNQRAPSCWDCFCSVRLGLDQPEHGLHVTYRIRLTAGVHQEEGGSWFFDTMHASEASRTQEEGEFFPLSFVLQGADQINRSTQKELVEILVQLMPGARDSDIDRLEQNIQKAGAMTAMLDRGMTLEQIAEAILDGFTVHFLDEAEIGYRCNCSEAKVTRALISLGEGELLQMADEGKPAEITCQFCDRVYTFTPESLRALAQSAKKN